MNYSNFIEKTGNNLIDKGYSCFIGNGIMVSICTNDFDKDYTLILENNESLSTLDFGERETIITSFYIAACMAGNGATYRTIEKAFDSNTTRENFRGYMGRWLTKKEFEAIKEHNVFLTRKSYYEEHKKEHRQYYQENRERLLAYGKEYRRMKKRSA